MRFRKAQLPRPALSSCRARASACARSGASFATGAGGPAMKSPRGPICRLGISRRCGPSCRAGWRRSVSGRSGWPRRTASLPHSSRARFQEATGRWRIVTPAVEGRLSTEADHKTGPAIAGAGLAADLPVRAHEKVRVFGFQRRSRPGGHGHRRFRVAEGTCRARSRNAGCAERGVRWNSPHLTAIRAPGWLVRDLDLGDMAAVFDGLDWAATAGTPA